MKGGGDGNVMVSATGYKCTGIFFELMLYAEYFFVYVIPVHGVNLLCRANTQFRANTQVRPYIVVAVITVVNNINNITT
jgi:hypothetical protein